MNHFSRFAPWVNRLVLAAATLIFTMIGLRYIVDPVPASAATGVTLNSALATTVTRVGFGAFPLSFAIFSSVCLLSTRRLLIGASLVATIAATAIAVRLFGVAVDGAVPESTRLFIPETVLLVVSLAGILLERARRNHPPSEATWQKHHSREAAA
jgi:hypothetical protein